MIQQSRRATENKHTLMHIYLHSCRAHLVGREGITVEPRYKNTRYMNTLIKTSSIRIRFVVP
jgi:hypothetical protein